jgi:hypothetical protein
MGLRLLTVACKLSCLSLPLFISKLKLKDKLHAFCAQTWAQLWDSITFWESWLIDTHNPLSEKKSSANCWHKSQLRLQRQICHIKQTNENQCLNEVEYCWRRAHRSRDSIIAVEGIWYKISRLAKLKQTCKHNTVVLFVYISLQQYRVMNSVKQNLFWKQHPKTRNCKHKSPSLAPNLR